MKWLILFIWIGSVLFVHWRGMVRLPLKRQLLDHSIILAPLNTFMILSSKVPTTPYVPVSRLPELKQLEDNWETVRNEALHLAHLKEIKAPDAHNDIGFNSLFKYGWKRFYLKWYDAKHPSAESLCPKTIALLKQIPTVKAAVFAELPPGGKLNPHRDPYAGSLRYHLGLSTPNDDQCYLDVDGIRHVWHDGEGVLFDATFLHEAHNQTDTKRIILFCDVERPLKWRWAQSLNRWIGRYLMSATSSPNTESDQTGIINKLAHWHWVIDQQRQAFKAANRSVYTATKAGLIVIAILLFLAI